MRFLTILALFCLVGCGTTETAEKVQAKQVPVLITEKDGVKVWRVRDSFPGGASHVYFTTPSSNTEWEVHHDDHTDKHRTVNGKNR